MGHRGSWGYLYDGQYYIIYNHWCHPESLGNRLVSAVPSEPDAFKVWLAETQFFLEQVEDEVDESLNYHDIPNVLSLSSYAPSTSLEGGDRYEFSYLYDLDRMVFTMNERIHFPLDNLPPYREWISYIAQDGSEYPCILPSTPDMYRIPVDERMYPIQGLSASEIADLKLYEGVHPETIYPSSWHGEAAPRRLSVARHLAKIIFAGFISARYSRISNMIAEFSDLVFEDLAMELLTAGAPANSTLTAGSKVVNDLAWQHQLKNSPKCARLRELTGTAHPPKRERCNAFWFRGRLIVLARTLVREDHFKAKIGFVIRRAREKELRECTALLWSVHHVAVVVVSGEIVSHSEAIPVVAAFGREGEECKRQFDEGVELLLHYLSPIASDGGNSFGSRMPMDTLIRIMDFTDEKTSTALGMTSKALRLECLQHPWIGPLVVTGLCSNDDGFLARLEKTGQPWRIFVRTFECIPYLDELAAYERQEGVKLVVYRLPFRFVDESYYDVIRISPNAPNFSRIHGYEIQAEMIVDGKYICLPPLKNFRP